VPIVFNNVADPVGSGFVDSLARPGGNVTGFLGLIFSQSAHTFFGLVSPVSNGCRLRQAICP
jgi:hypothetical protein